MCIYWDASIVCYVNHYSYSWVFSLPFISLLGGVEPVKPLESEPVEEFLPLSPLPKAGQEIPQGLVVDVLFDGEAGQPPHYLGGEALAELGHLDHFGRGAVVRGGDEVRPHQLIQGRLQHLGNGLEGRQDGRLDVIDVDPLGGRGDVPGKVAVTGPLHSDDGHFTAELLVREGGGAGEGLAGVEHKGEGG